MIIYFGLVLTAQKTRIFATPRHWTALSSLVCYGRHTLLNFGNDPEKMSAAIRELAEELSTKLEAADIDTS